MACTRESRVGAAANAREPRISRASVGLSARRGVGEGESARDKNAQRCAYITSVA